ncbi:MAG: cytochrome c biogenesis protein CcsA, partial [Clostridia bacterium]|nr:cytochrome c biogenesis protein CcsA [Deltaproteobacteria bacterium]
ALAVAGVYLYVERVQGSKVTGAFQLAMVVLLQLIASTLTQHAATPGTAVTSQSTFGLHIVAAILAHAAFFVGAVYAVMYVHLYRALKRKRFGVLFERLPPLDTLAGMGFGATALGWVLLTASIVIGVILSHSVSGSFSEPHVLSAVGVWLIYGVALVAYFVLGWKGARSVYLALVGFIVAVLTISGSALWPMFHRIET